MKVKVVVEVDAEERVFRSAIIYLTSTKPFRGTELIIELRDGLAVTDCWPRWPDDIQDLRLIWKSNSYPRYFNPSKTRYSFGVRLRLSGPANLSARIHEWRYGDGLVKLEASRSEGLKAIVGPFTENARVFEKEGALAWVSNGGIRYFLVEGKCVRLYVEANGGYITTGCLEYTPKDLEMPFSVSIKTRSRSRSKKLLIARLSDLYLTNGEDWGSN
ncbi:MAG: hypothetical protein QW291_02685 [Thermofilaceae archaeon]